MNNYRYPFITGKDPAEKLVQIESYLRQLVDKMNAESYGNKAGAINLGNTSSAARKEKAISQATFDEIKSLIINSADIVDAFYEQYYKKLSGYYVAKSEFGSYVEDVSLQIEANAKELSTTVESVEAIVANSNQFQSATKEQFTQLKQTADGITASVSSILTDGVDKVKTEKGYTFDDTGLTISEEGNEITNTLTNDGMYIKRSGGPLLVADANGVNATDVTVNNYLVVGGHARFEDYPTNRTACFYLD